MDQNKSFLVAAVLVATIGLCGFMLFAESQTVIKTEVRLVEVYATVFDGKGTHVEGLTRDQFEIRDNGELREISMFESVSSEISCAILLDATGSMQGSLPAVKNAVFHLIDRLRENDRVAVYTFNNSLTCVQDFTADKQAAKRAVLDIRAGGGTALFDALAEIVRDLGQQNGKKSVILFTDGADNSSFLYPGAALSGARAAGIPIYTIAQGEALENRGLLEQLKQIASWTGALTYSAKGTREIDRICDQIRLDLRHTYLLAYPAPAGQEAGWRTIRLAVKGRKNLRVRAKEGYLSN